jgi:predicted small lipoprotein YifL
MLKMSKCKRLALAVSLFCVLTACGQKGDLFIPEGESVASINLG